MGAVGIFRHYPVRSEGRPDLAGRTALVLPPVPLENFANQELRKVVAKAFQVRITPRDFERLARRKAPMRGDERILAEVGAAIKGQLNARGITQEKLAELVDLHPELSKS